jgi:GNAT superfamily N-acetyltransferase
MPTETGSESDWTLVARDVGPCRIRPATIEDAGLILRFIEELASFEQAAEQVISTERMLEEQLFGERPAAEVVIAEVDGEARGFALFFHNFSTWLGRRGLYLEDLYVSPEARGTGIGKALLSYLAGVAVSRGCGRIDWWVLDWNTDAIEFYRSIGAVPQDDWTVFRLTGEALQRMASPG